MNTVTVATFCMGIFLFGNICLEEANGAPAGNATVNDTSSGKGNNNGNAYYHDYHYYGHNDYNDNGKHPGHHEYDGGDDLFSHVKTNLTHDPDHSQIYHEYVHFGFSQHGHHDGNETGGIIEKVKKYFRNSGRRSSLSNFSIFIPLGVFPCCFFLLGA